MRKKFVAMLLGLLPCLTFACTEQGIALQVLGSGGPEINDGRSSSSYLIWVDGKARFMIDMGGGSAWRFEESGAQFEDLEGIAFTHLHIDHVSDLPVLVKASFFSKRNKDLYLYGPAGNDILPSFDNFIDSLFNRQTGAYKYMGSFFDPQARTAFTFVPHTIAINQQQVQTIEDLKNITLSTIPVMHGLLPSLAWRVDIEGKSITISGDMNGRTDHLSQLADNTDILVAHTAINEQTKGAGSFLHMKPSKIGQIAAKARVKQLILSHFMNRSSGHDDELRKQINEYFSGRLEFASDLSCWPL